MKLSNSSSFHINTKKLKELIEAHKNFFTLNNEKIRCRSFNKDKNKKKMKKEENEKNLSV